jgi:hypothetical protein
MGDEDIYAYPEDHVRTKFGVVKLWSTGIGHVGLSSAGDEYFEVNGVEMSVRVDLHRRDDGVYRPGQSAAQYYTAFTGHRFDFKPVSDSARRKILVEAEEVVNAYVKEFPAFVLEGERKKLLQERDRFTRERDELQEQVTAINDRIIENREALYALMGDPQGELQP